MLSKQFLTERGYCCGHGCLMCPYEPKHIKDNTLLKVANCFKEDRVSVEEGETIAGKLFQVLNKRGDGIGLAANQVGIDASVAVVNVKEPIVLINPKIVRKEEETRYYEGCLSYPKKGCHTKRYKIVEVEADNYKSNLTFGAGDTEVDLLESVCVQHEIDHLNGMRILDRIVNTTYRAERKLGRNEQCYCGSGKKYKKCCINK
jgi:peptide deformylase